MNVIKPTCNQIYNEELNLKDSKIDETWRHGNRRTEIYFRKQDQTYWRVKYRVSTDADGETHGLIQGTANITQVEPFEKVIISYREIP